MRRTAGISKRYHVIVRSYFHFRDEVMEERTPCVYILTNVHRTVLYTGVTSNLPYRIWQHRRKLVEGFSKQYNVDCLVWYEQHFEMYAAITREKQIKKWNRNWKIELIETFNPAWRDLYEEVIGSIN